MKIPKELKNIKCDLMINFDLKEIYEPVPDTYIKSKWDEIMAWFKLMLEKGNSEKCFQEVYMEIDDLLINDIPLEVIKSIEDILTDYSNNIKTSLNSLLDKKGEEFFKQFNELWSSITKIFNLLRKIMNKYEKLAYGNIQKNNVYEIFLYHLKSALIDSNKESNIIQELDDKNFIKHSMTQILEQITLLREKLISKLDEKEKDNINEIKMDIEEEINNNDKNSKYSELTQKFSEKIRLLIRFYCETGIYQEYFNKELINNTENYYRKKTDVYIDNNDIDKYINYVEEILEFENYLIINHLNEITLKPVLNKLNIILLSEKKSIIFSKYYKTSKDSQNSSEAKLVLNSDYILMKKIFILFKNIKLEEEIRKKFSEYIVSTCKYIYSKFSKNYKIFYESIIALKKNIDNYITESYLSEEKFKSTSKESLTKGINQKPGYICDIFSNYIDDVLRYDADKKPLNEIKIIIDEYMTLFKYIGNKDLFENYFIKKLCIRCLYGLNKSEEAQNYLIEQLKKECGPYFVSKSQEMISDVKASQEMSTSFNEDLIKKEKKNKNENIINIPINYFVLSNYTWPIDKLIGGEINNFDINKYEKKFFDFYHKKNSGKSLFWHLPYCFGEVEMELKESNNSIKIIGNGVHIAILKCFTKSQISLSLKDIIKKTKIEKDVISKYIKKLVNKNILKYEDNIYLVNFYVNKDEKNNEIMLIDYDEKEDEIEGEENDVKNIEERKFVIDAYIMKILKQKKVMKRSELISAVSEKMIFDEKYDEIINKRIEQLIKGRFISKDEEDQSLIKYC